jgi:hypothetical protein
MIKTNVKGVQEAKAAIKKSLEEFASNKFITVGIHEDAGSREDGETNAQIGAFNHFGTINIPARPWLDVGVMQGASVYSDVIKNTAEAGGNLDQALEQVGVLAVGYAQEYITELSDPPNSPATIAMKGSSNPLIDTGVMRSSVSYKVAEVKPEEGIG